MVVVVDENSELSNIKFVRIGRELKFFFFLSKYFVSCYAKQQEPMFVDDFQNNYYTKKIVL